MRENYTHIVLVLDGSGSMGHIKAGTLEGLNAFVKSQKDVPGDATLSLYQFSGRIPNPNKPEIRPVMESRPGYGQSVGVANAIWPFQYGDTIEVNGHRVVYDFAHILNVRELTNEDYQPSGGTPLLDTIGTAIVETGQKLAGFPESLRPSKVLFVIQTDGQENESKKYTRAKINEMIKHQQEVYKWEFIFLGANQDAIKSGESLGIGASKSVNYGFNNLSASASLDVIGRKTAMYRSAVSYEAASAALDMNAQDRIDAMGSANNSSGVAP